MYALPVLLRFIQIYFIKYADSAALSMQALSPRLQKIPRVFFTMLAFLIFTIASVAGRQHFSAILSNFLAVVRTNMSSHNP